MIRDALRKNQVADECWRWEKEVRIAKKKEEEARALIEDFQSETLEQRQILFNKIRHSNRRDYDQAHQQYENYLVYVRKLAPALQAPLTKANQKKLTAEWRRNTCGAPSPLPEPMRKTRTCFVCRLPGVERGPNVVNH